LVAHVRRRRRELLSFVFFLRGARLQAFAISKHRKFSNFGSGAIPNGWRSHFKKIMQTEFKPHQQHDHLNGGVGEDSTTVVALKVMSHLTLWQSQVPPIFDRIKIEGSTLCCL
jgi:hypothetical protein